MSERIGHSSCLHLYQTDITHLHPISAHVGCFAFSMYRLLICCLATLMLALSFKQSQTWFYRVLM